MASNQIFLISPLDTGNLVQLGGQVIASFRQNVLWLQRIREDTIGAAHTAGWDETRQLATVYSDGSVGVGWSAPDAVTLRMGYMAPQRVSVGIVDNPTMEVQTASGLLEFTGATVIYQEPPDLSKGDVLVLLDTGRRFVVGDSVETSQTLGQDVLLTALLEERSPGDPIYSIPLS